MSELDGERVTVGLYESHKKIYPKYQRGFFRKIRWVISYLIMGFYFVTPFIRWERSPGFPNQAVLFDLPGRKFYIFDWVIWPQEVYLLAFLLIVLAIGLFFVTAVAGRVFCGYLCFQTLFTDLFLYIEYRLEGHYRKRRTRDLGPWSVAWLLRKLATHLFWVLISVFTGATFVFWFADVYQMSGRFLDGTAPFAAWCSVGLLSLSTYIFAGFAREQVCLYMCPYARFQGAMFDQDTLIIAYNEERGEPRMANRRVRTQGQGGDCIDCGQCFVVCPTGIDIRHGQQYECITCAACIDACDEVMDKVGKPKGLIGYTSFKARQGLPTRVLRGRVYVYTALIGAVFAGIVWTLSTLEPVKLSVIRHRQPIYILLSNGDVQNNFTLRILNRTRQQQDYRLEVQDLPGSTLSFGARLMNDTRGQPLLSVASGEVVPFTVYVRQDKSHLDFSQQNITFVLTSVAPSGGKDHYESVFFAPGNRRY